VIEGFLRSLEAELFGLVGRCMLNCVCFFGACRSTEFEPPTSGNCCSIFSNFSKICFATLYFGACLVAGDAYGPFLENLPASPLFFKDGRFPAGDLDAF
jgi:hypothetical protein